MDEWTRPHHRGEDGPAVGGRPRDQPLLPLPSASSAGDPASLSTVIQTTLPAPRNERDSPARRFVRASLARYVWLPDTPARTSRYDRRLVQTLFEHGVDILTVEAALLLATARRALREPWLTPLPPVRSFAYFQPALAEVLDNPRPPDLEYLTCLLRRLRPLAEVKAARIAHQAHYAFGVPR